MNLMPQLFNVCKYTGSTFRFKSRQLLDIKCFATNSGSQGSAGRLKTNEKGIDEKFQLIYKPPNNDLLQVATSFCALSSVCCPLFLGTFVYDTINGRNSEFVEQVSTLELSGMGAACVISMTALYICYKIPMRIYNHETEYIAILPSFIPGMTRQFKFKKGDIVDKKMSKKTNEFLAKILKPGFEMVSFYKIKNKRLLLTVKCFQKPIQFFEMFANTEKYIRKLKR